MGCYIAQTGRSFKVKYNERTHADDDDDDDDDDLIILLKNQITGSKC
jgi:hypothetical protein